MTYLEMLRAKKAELEAAREAAVEEMESIVTDDTGEARSDLTDDELAAHGAAVEKVEGIDTDLEETERSIERQEKIAKRATKAKDVPFNTNPGTSGDVFDIDLRTAPRTDDVVRDTVERAKRAVGESPHLTDEQRELADKLVRRNDGGAAARHIITTGRPAYRSAFGKMMGSAMPILTEEEGRAIEEVRAINLGTDTQGGHLMPYELDPTIIATSDGNVNPIREEARIKTVTGDNWHGVSSAGVTASYGAESDEVADGTPTLAPVDIDVEWCQAFVPVTIMAQQDLSQLDDDVTAMLQQAKDDVEATKFTLGAGSGSDEPLGVITAVAAVAGSRVAAAVNDTYAVGDLYAVQNDLPARHRARAKWMMALQIINLTRQFGTAQGHAFITDLADGKPPVMLGQSLRENSAMDGVIDAAADNDVVLYGDFDKYQIVDRIGMQIELVPHLFGANRRPIGQRGWYAHWRNGAGVLDANAFRLLRV